jgi:hypothetical protein
LKKILFLFLLSLPAIRLLAQTTAPYGQYDVIFNVNNIYTSANTDGNCPNYFQFFILEGSSWTNVWSVENGLSGSKTSWSDKYPLTHPAGQPPVMPGSMYVNSGRSWNHTIGGCGGPSGPSATVALPSTPCTIQNYGSFIPQWNSTVTVQIVPDNVTIYDTASFLPDNDPIQLVATQGFASSVYDWQYSTNNGASWNEFPPQFQGRSTIVFSGSQMMQSQSVFDSYIGSAAPNTFIRVNYGCGNTYSNTLTLEDLPSSPHILSATGFPNRCFGDATGYATIQFDRALYPGETLTLFATNTATGDQLPAQQDITLTAGHTFTWPQVMPAGQYFLLMHGSYQNPGFSTYTDGLAERATVSIVPPAAVSYTAVKGNDVYCYGGSDGSIKINANGGVGNFQLGVEGPGQTAYAWSPFSTSLQTNVAGLSPGSYSLRVMDSNNCVEKDASLNEVITTIPITQPATPVQLDFSNVVNPLAYGYTDGQITAVIKGGTPAAGGSYTIDWADPVGNGVSTVTNTVLGSGYQTVLNDGGNGTYTLQVTDANYALAAAGQQQGCLLQQTFTLVQPPPLVVNIQQTKRVTCHGYATAQLIAHGAGGIEIPNTRYHYQWAVQNGGTPSSIGSDDSVLSLLPAGFYQVTITDNNGIPKTSSLFMVSEPYVLAVTIATTPLACNVDSTGIATPTVTGGTLPYSYNWSTGDTTEVIAHLTEGGYFLFVSDSNSCQTQQAAGVTAPNGLVIDTVVMQPTCNQRCDGSIRLNVTGGAGGYTYVWNTGLSNSGLTALCAGDFNVRISDANGCTALRKFTLTDPPLLAVHAGQNTTLCNGQTYAADATVSDPAAQYLWTGSNGFSAITPQVTLSDTGTYWVTATNSHGCFGRDTFAISQTNKYIGADFVVSTQVFQGQPVTIVNISQPDPDSVSWMFPDTTVLTVLSQGQVSATLQFNDTGSYAIGLKSWSAPCWKVVTQQLVVLKPQTFDNPGTVTDPLVRSFTVAPNPSTGSFTVVVTLSSAANIRIRMVSMLTDAIMDDRQLSGSSQYTLPYNMGNIAKGGYFLLLETSEGSSVYKLVIL